MAKRSRSAEQTFLKQAFQHESNSQTGYKQLKYDENGTTESTPEHQAQLSATSLANLSAGLGGDPSPTRKMTNIPGGYINGRNMYRKTNSYLNNGSGSHVISPHNISHITSSHSLPGGGNGPGYHYAANISTAGPTLNTGSSKKTLLDMSRPSAHVAYPVTSPSHLTGHLIQSTPHTIASLSDPTVACSNLSSGGIRELLASLALMCVLSLLMAFLALFFLQKSCSLSWLSEDSSMLGGNSSSKAQAHRLASNNNLSANQFSQRILSSAREYHRVFQISVSLSTLTIALDLCCLFVCCIQFLSIVKLMKTAYGKKRCFEFIKKTSHIRVLAIGAFLVSIPLFFTGVILYTFVNFDEIPALITSVIIGIGIIFCGVASVQNVYLWQWEKTKASQEMQQAQHQQHQPSSYSLGETQFVPYGTMSPVYPLELSTLV